jgi:acyl dehydratase
MQEKLPVVQLLFFCINTSCEVLPFNSFLTNNLQPILLDMDIEPVINASFEHLFSFTQDDVIRFAELTGDNNPLHLDADYAATTNFKRPIIHGMLGATVFTKVLGTQFPGFGSIYLKQTLEFLRPMFVDTEYKAVFTIKTIQTEKHIAEIATDIVDVNTKKVVTRGVATMINEQKF